jgi:acyl-CoA thioesterase
MADAFFIPAGAGRFDPTGNLPGPWHPGMMHGGPPSALMAHAILDHADSAPVPEESVITRIAVEFLKPVPVEPVEIRCETVRPGRRVALVKASMKAGEEQVMKASAWLSRTEPTEVPETPVQQAPPEVALESIDPEGWSNGYLQAVEWGWVEGRFEEPGPATVWARPRFPLVAGTETRPIELVLLLVDSGSGISAVASPTELIFVNVDLTVHSLRQLEGKTMWMRAETLLDGEGTGLTTTTFGDRRGQTGVAAQSLFVAAV